MTRGILYIVWNGDCNTPDLLERAKASVQEHHPELPIHVETLPDGSTLLDKAKMLDLSPFESTLFLDADTVVMERLDYGFEMAERHQVACCINECPYARRYLGLQHLDDLRELNTGVLFFTKDAKPVFDRWQELNATINSAHHFMSNRGKECMPVNDQAGFAGAVHDLRFNPFVLPVNWNFRKGWHRSVFGPIKVWHWYEDPPDAVYGWNREHSKERGLIRYGELAA